MKLNPKLNSPGRFGKPDIVLELFLENDLAVIEKLAAEIDAIDRDRYRAVTRIMKKIESTCDTETGFILSSDNCRGFSGIIASRLSEKYNRPFMVCYEKDDFIRGSMRTPEGYYLHTVKCEMEKYMDEMGGHGQAAGFKCSAMHIEELKSVWNSTEWHTDKIKNYDCELDIDNLNPVLIKEIFYYLEPFGKGNPVPVFLCSDVFIKTIRAEEDPSKKFWVKKNGSFFEAVSINGINLTCGQEKTDIFYTPYLRESGGLYRIFLKISGFKNH